MSQSTSTSSKGHGYERYQAPQFFKPCNVITPVDLAGAPGTALAQFRFPGCWDRTDILAMGFHYAAPGGVQSVAGSMRLVIGGQVVLDADGLPFVVESEPSHFANYNAETELNRTTGETELQQGPMIPVADSNDLVELQIETQGVGGDQTVIPYLIVRIHNPQ